MTNLTLRLPPEKAEEIKEELLRMGFHELKEENLLWALSDGKRSLRLYPSGTLLIQGRDAGGLRDWILSMIDVPVLVHVGCDESGKGDVFGPLVLCCAVVKPEYYKKVLSLNMKDCKKLKDDAVLKKSETFRSFGEFKCRLVEPKELNELYEKMKNLNRILDKLYLNLLEEFLKKYPHGRFSVDAYSKTSPFDPRVNFEHKGEEDLAVASASVLARAEFLRWLKNRGLPKGASPHAMELARRLYQKAPEEAKKLLKVFFL